MTCNGKRWLAAATVLAFAALFVGVGIRLSWADEPKSADLTDLRDAVKAASKRGDNVDEVAKALDAFDKAMAKGFKAGREATTGRADGPAQRGRGRGPQGRERRRHSQATRTGRDETGRAACWSRPSRPRRPSAIRLRARVDPPARRFPNDLQVRPRIEFPPLPQSGLPKSRGVWRRHRPRSAPTSRWSSATRRSNCMLKDPNDPRPSSWPSKRPRKCSRPLPAVAGES